MADSRWILVDDTDPGIQYIGSWFPDQGSQNDLGNFGQPYLHTLHGINTDGSFSYTFTGSKALISGTVQYPVSDSGPTWVCTVDGIPAISFSDTTLGENRIRLCEIDKLSDAQHNITLKTLVSINHTFWVDYIQYEPYPDVPLDNVALSIDNTDPQLHYGAGWQKKFPGAYTKQTGSNFTFDFSGTYLLAATKKLYSFLRFQMHIGTSLTWVGFYDNTLPMAPSTATYSIDGGAPVTFNLNGISANATGVQYSQIFFESGKLASGNHKLQVVYGGNSQTTPLTLYILQLQNGTASTSTSPVANPSSSSSIASLPSSPAGTLPPGNSSKSPSNLAAIVGGVIGGLALLILIFALLFLYRRRKHNKADSIAQPLFDPAPVVPFHEHSESRPASNFYNVPAATLSTAKNGRNSPFGTVTPYQTESSGHSSMIKSIPLDMQTPSPSVSQRRAEFVTPNSIVPTNQILPPARSSCGTEMWDHCHLVIPPHNS